jgi:peptide chain release factor 2
LNEQLKLKKDKQTGETFWQDMELVKKNGKEIKAIEAKLNIIKEIKKREEDIEFLIEILEMEDDEKTFADLKQKLKTFAEFLEENTIATLLNGKYDDCDAILSIHAGAGGTEAQDWASMLFRMYSHFCENNGYTLKVLDTVEGDEAGLKSITFLVSGDKAYGYLKAESGVHRLVRISPFDANKRRHTSFASLEVMPEIEDTGDIEINPDDIRIDTYRSSGAGGQHINKTDSAIRITHFPTGIVVTCQNERSQIQNREMAFKVLKSKLATLKEQEQQKNLKEIKGEIKKIEWGSQIRSYVFCPYTMVKDHRTGYETSNVLAVMDGDIKPFILDYLKKSL